MNITSFGNALQIKGPTIYRWYRDVLSDYAKDKGIVHKHDVIKSVGNKESPIEVPIMKEENFGANMAIDEKYIGEDFCTVLSNRDSGKLALVCKCVNFSDLQLVLQQHSHLTKNIKTITRDFSSLFEKVCTKLMPQATQIGDKFHVIKNLLEAHQDVRIRFRQQELDKRRKAHSEFKKSEKERLLECERTGNKYKSLKFKYNEDKMSNGETLLEILARSRYLLYKYPHQWSSKQHNRAQIVFEMFPEIQKTYNLCNQFRNLMSKNNVGKHELTIDKELNQWYENVEEADIDEILNFKSMVEANEDMITNYFINADTNAIAESINSKIQKFIITNNGNRDKDFFYFRLANYYA